MRPAACQNDIVPFSMVQAWRAIVDLLCTD
jgi:hypothetical protein